MFSVDGKVLLDLNLEKKRHEPIQFNLSRDAPHLATLIQDSYQLYPREFVFTPKNKYPKLDKKSQSIIIGLTIKRFILAYWQKCIS